MNLSAHSSRSIGRRDAQRGRLYRSTLGEVEKAPRLRQGGPKSVAPTRSAARAWPRRVQIEMQSSGLTLLQITFRKQRGG
jgi:hypothetical protein